MSGAGAGAALGPWGAAGGALVGGLSGLFGGGRSEEEKLALEQQKAQIERSNQFWKQAQGQMGMAQNYFAPIAGGSRQAALESMAPQIQGATQRMDAGRQSLFNLASRSGGAAQQIDPYAKASVATGMLQQARPQAAQSMMDIGKTTGGWAAQNQAGVANTLFDQGRFRDEQSQKQGAAFYDSLEKFLKQGQDAGWFKNIPGMSKGKSGTGLATPVGDKMAGLLG
jgi:hypothetical protein